jgi:hypothetical protein
VRAAATLLLITIVACKRKTELIPEGARQVTRTDEREGDVSLRRYNFSLDGADFVCESRTFADAEAALVAAKKSIAERPLEEMKSTDAYFARSGRSLWLRQGRQIVWCMLASGKKEAVDQNLKPVRDLFMRRYQEGT